MMNPRRERTAGIPPLEIARRFVARCAWLGRSPARRDTAHAATREAAQAELRRTVAAWPPLEPSAGASETTNHWNRRRREIRQYLLAQDPFAFLTWTPIVRSMTYGLLPWIRTEFRSLQSSGWWQSRWKGALRENWAGLPMPSHVYPVSSGTLIHHAYHVHRFESLAGRAINELSEIVEFGGGYGSMARLAARLGFRGHYHLHDLPEFSALQRFYLRLVGSEIDEAGPGDTLSRITFSSRREEASPSNDRADGALFIATWSFGETPIGLREEWRPLLAKFRFFLIGYRDRFEHIDNAAWFGELAASRPDVVWRVELIRHRRETRHYLIGFPA